MGNEYIANRLHYKGKGDHEMRRMLIIILLTVPLLSFAQMYSGMTGLIHIPSAEMDNEGDARLGGHFLNKQFLPNSGSFKVDENKYHTWDVYLSLTPFKWVEIGYTMTFENRYPTGDTEHKKKYPMKDRYFSVKLNPLREGKYYPSVAIGMQDCASFGTEDRQGIFSNYYIVATKHLKLESQEIGLTVAYRHFSKYYNTRWNGVVGGVTYRPSFAKNWRVIVEWTGCDVNVGINCLLWSHLLLQASLQDGRYPSAGICYKVNLF